MPSEDKLDTVKLAQAINLARRYSVQNEYDLMQVRFLFGFAMERSCERRASLVRNMLRSFL
jgi:hypothetical protein